MEQTTWRHIADPSQLVAKISQFLLDKTEEEQEGTTQAGRAPSIGPSLSHSLEPTQLTNTTEDLISQRSAILPPIDEYSVSMCVF